MKDLRKIIGKRLHECRAAKKLTQAQVGEALGISQQQYMRYENGHRAPSCESLVSLCEFFRVSSDYLLGISEY